VQSDRAVHTFSPSPPPSRARCSWVIKMPTLHRIAVLRDDVIFLIFLYQRWIYPVDQLRKNEYGASGADYHAAAARAAGQQRVPLRSKYHVAGVVGAVDGAGVVEGVVDAGVRASRGEGGSAGGAAGLRHRATSPR